MYILVVDYNNTYSNTKLKNHFNTNFTKHTLSNSEIQNIIIYYLKPTFSYAIRLHHSTQVLFTLIPIVFSNPHTTYKMSPFLGLGFRYPHFTITKMTPKP
jgi:hypothetical protein